MSKNKAKHRKYMPCPMAKSLKNPMFRPKVIQSAKIYNRALMKKNWYRQRGN